MWHFSFHCFTKCSCIGLYIVHHSQAIVTWLSYCTCTIIYFFNVVCSLSVWFGVNHYWRKVSDNPIFLWFESLQGLYERSSELCWALHTVCWLFLQRWGRSKSPAQLLEKPKGTFPLTSAGLYSSWWQTGTMGLTQTAKGGFPDVAPMYYGGGICLCVCVLMKVAICSLVKILPCCSCWVGKATAIDGFS